MPYVRALARSGRDPGGAAAAGRWSWCPGCCAPLAGVCLSGGPDIDPAAYGAEPHAELGPVEPDLDAFELAVARHADAAGLPILGICRGCQTLNIARGGTLLQHLPDPTAPDRSPAGPSRTTSRSRPARCSRAPSAPRRCA